MNAPRNRTSRQSCTSRNTATVNAVPMQANSNMFAHGTRPAAMPRSTIDATWMTQARIVSANATRWYRLAPRAGAAPTGAAGGFSATSVDPAYGPDGAGRDAAAGSATRA